MQGELITRAAAFAARAHRGQTRRDGETPYFAHCARVAMIVRDAGCEDETILAAAFLHDTIEDTTVDYDEIEEHFGKKVAEMVASLTKNMILPERVREPEYDARLAAAPWGARLIKLADQIDNLLDTMSSGESVAKIVPKCKRALKLVANDDAPPIKSASERLRKLLKSVPKSS